MGDIPRGKIRPWDGRLISTRTELGQVGRTSSAFVTRRRSAGLRAVRERSVC
jgi:hypothetical protein